MLNFTLRDSRQDSVNLACWGEREEVARVGSCFRIGDCGTSKTIRLYRDRSKRRMRSGPVVAALVRALTKKVVDFLQGVFRKSTESSRKSKGFFYTGAHLAQ